MLKDGMPPRVAANRLSSFWGVIGDLGQRNLVIWPCMGVCTLAVSCGIYIIVKNSIVC